MALTFATALGFGPINHLLHVTCAQASTSTIGYLINTEAMGPTYGGKLRIPLGLREAPPHFEEASGTYAVSDSSWARRPRPYGGHVVMRMNGPVLWSARQFKTCVPDSSAEAETAEASRATKSLMFVKAVCCAARMPAMGVSALLIDNSATTEHVKKEGPSQKVRHFERPTMLVKWAVLRLLIALHLVSTDYMIADLFTKAVDKDTFQRLRNVIRTMSRWTAA